MKKIIVLENSMEGEPQKINVIIKIGSAILLIVMNAIKL